MEAKTEENKSQKKKSTVVKGVKQILKEIYAIEKKIEMVEKNECGEKIHLISSAFFAFSAA